MHALRWVWFGSRHKFFAVITQWSRGLIFCTCRPIGNNNNKYEGLELCNPIKSCEIVPLKTTNKESHKAFFNYEPNQPTEAIAHVEIKNKH